MIQAYIDTKDPATLNAAKIPVPIDLVLKLSNNLMKPDVDFDINFQSYNSSLKTIFDNLTTSMKNNENELSRQVFGIIVLNRFMPPIYSPLPNNNLNANDAVNTVNDYLANQLTNYLSDWISNFITDVNFGVKYRQYTQSQDEKTPIIDANQLRRELQLSISKKFLNNRVILNLGGNFDFGNNSSTNVKSYAGGDFELEYILSKDGNVRIRAFSKGQYDAFNSKAINRTGAGITIRKEFEDFNELRNGKNYINPKEIKKQ
jgi:hypothetical protein